MLKIFQVRVGGTLCYFIFCMQNTLQNVSKKPFLKSKILGTPILGVVPYSMWMASACAWACPRRLPRLRHVSAGTGKAMLRETNTKFSWINTIRADFSLASDVQQGLVASGFCSRWWLGLREALPCCSCVIWRVTHQLLTRFASGVVRGTSAHSLLSGTSHSAPTYCVGLWNVQKHVGVCSLGNEGQGYIERVRLMLRFGGSRCNVIPPLPFWGSIFGYKWGWTMFL